VTLIGLLVVFGSVAGGFAIAGGDFHVLLQPSEFVVICGAALGTLITSSPGQMRKRVIHALKAAFKDGTPTPKDYTDLLKLMFELFTLMRREGMLALEPHLADPTKSDLFKKYPSVAKQHDANSFLIEGLQQVVSGVSPDELDASMDAEIDTFKDGGHLTTTLIKGVSDSLPGIGIVAAVLGIIVTMNHMDAPPAVIGHHVAAALVGTFLGILLCYGMLSPIATSVEMQETHVIRYMHCIRLGLVASLRGSPPNVSVDLARRAIFVDERPTFAEMDKLVRSTKG